MRLILAVAAFLFAGTGAPVPPIPADPALWVARDGDTTIYLFGSVHWLKPDIGWFDDEVRAAFDASDMLVLESVAPPGEQARAETQELGTSAAGPTLPERLPSAMRPKLAAALKSVGYSADAFDQTEPWLAATSLSVLPLQQAGYDSRQGVETVLTAAARAAGKPVTGFETTRTQLGYFDTLPDDVQIAMLVRVLDGIDAVVASNDATLAAWRTGDVAALRAIVESDMAQSSREFADALVTRRNARWADWLERRMRAPGTVFVAVGSAHLVGPGDVLSELQRRGIKVTRVDAGAR